VAAYIVLGSFCYRRRFTSAPVPAKVTEKQTRMFVASVAFLILLFPALGIGRQLGWRLSRSFLYAAPLALTVAACLVWGTGLAYLLRLMIGWLKPFILVELIGFGAGAYLSIPNYELFVETSMPRNLHRRHSLVSNLSLGTFILASFAFAYRLDIFLTLLLLTLLAILGALVWKLAVYAWKFKKALAGRNQILNQHHKPARVDFPIGRCKLDAAADVLTGLTEFSQAQYALMGRVFEGEQNYNGPPVEFLVCSWKLMLGTVYGRIYKIAIYLEELTREEASRIAMDTFHYCYEKLGEPSEQKIGQGFPWGTGFFVWNAMDGNAILQTVEVDASFAINFAITSSSTKDFKRL
jgi:hypothetical protein